MIDPVPSNRLLRASATVSHWLLWPLVAFWVALLIVWGGIQGWIVPRIGLWRPLMEQEATHALGVPVRIGDVTAHSPGLLPSFEMTDVSLLDPQGRVALHLPKVVGTISPSSLWNLGFEQLVIDQPELDIRRTRDGKILVAGLDFAQQKQSGSNDGADWLFSQTEVFVRQGTVHWTDEQRSANPLALTGVDLVMRNGGREHNLRLDATPPPEWGRRFSFRSRFRQPLLSTRHSQWRSWEGQLYAEFEQVNVSHLQQYVNLGVDISQGNGALRLWADVANGELTGGTVDAALYQVNARLGKDLAPLELEKVLGRVSTRKLAGGFEVSTQGLQFQTSDGLHWPGGNVLVSYADAEGRVPAQGDFKADRLDLQALGQIANRLPLGAQAHAALQAYQPKGLVERIQVHWQGQLDTIDKYSASGKITGLEVPTLSPAAAAAAKLNGPPVGVSGLSLDFEANQAGGKAHVSIAQGALEFPGVYDEARIPVDQLSTDAKWQIDDTKWAVQLADTKFANADAQGELTAQWHTLAVPKNSGKSRFPGVLDLQGTLSRANGARVYRYLPDKIMPNTREYVQAAVLQGNASNVKFKIKGDLSQVPFTSPNTGEFKIVAPVTGVTLAYVPKFIQRKGDAPWPALSQLTGELVFDHASMSIRNISGSAQQWPALTLTNGEVQIPDLTKGAVLGVSTDLHGPVADALHFVSTSPVGAMLNHGLDAATGTGNADIKLKLSVPLANADKTKVQGNINFNNNDLHITPESPVLGRVRGQLQFTESGMSLSGVQARILGGDARVEGGMKPTTPGAEPVLQLKAQGTITAEGVRGARELGFWSRLANGASGSSSYNATFGVRKGIAELNLTSSLQGLALGLPAPLNKTADASLPLRFDKVVLPDSAPLRDRMTLELGKLASVVYERDVSKPVARVLHGSIDIGGHASSQLGAMGSGVNAFLDLSNVDATAWIDALAAPPGSPSSTSAGSVADSDPVWDYLPNAIAVRANSLNYGPYQLSNVVAGGSREGQTWRANLQADELNGYLEIRQPSGNNPGRVYARLAQLKITPNAVAQVETLLDEQPRTMPALDIVVEDFELRRKPLGRLEIDAVNHGAATADGDTREWRLNKFNIHSPEGSLTANGNWAAIGGTAPTDRKFRPRTPNRRTVLNFRFDVSDAGGLLNRLGMKDVFRRGKGKLEGQMSWTGSPLSPDYASLGGQFNLNVENGQFLKVDPGAAKLLGVLSLQSLPRRLTLDFRDLFSAGFAFDVVRGDVKVVDGVATTKNLQMKGVNAAVLMEGQADIVRETANLRVVVVPEINAGTASLIWGALNPVAGIASFLAQLLARDSLIQNNTKEFHVDGSWSDPKTVEVEHHPTNAASAPAKAL